MKQSRNNRISLRRTHLEELEPRRVLAGLGDDAPPLPEGAAGELIQQYAGLLQSPAQFTLYGSNINYKGKAPRSLRGLGSQGSNLKSNWAAARVYESESLDANLLGLNDIPEDAQYINLGFAAGQQEFVPVRGSIEEPNQPGSVFSVEDDGSIPKANATNLTSEEAVLAAGTIGDGPQADGDVDFFQLEDVLEGDLITVRVKGSAGFDPAVAVYNSFGELLISNDNSGDGVDSYLSLVAPENDDYYVAVVGSGFFGYNLPANPFDSTSLTPAILATTGDYEATIGRNYGDIDYYTFDLAAGDIFNLDMLGASNDVTLFDSNGIELIGSRGPLGPDFFPLGSDLTSDGNATIPYVINQTGSYYVRVLGDFTGNYEGRFHVHRPVLEDADPGTEQILFLDFDGETIDTSIFGRPRITTLSPLSTFLGDWGLGIQSENRVIDSIVKTVKQKFRTVGQDGLNGDYAKSGQAGEYGIEIRNSRDHADPFGQPNVTRMIVGGTIEELDIETIAIAQSVDPGNFVTSETGVVLLDSLSAPEFDPITGFRNDQSINSFLFNEPEKDKYDLIGAGVGIVIAHEAGHLFGNYHTEPSVERPNIMVDTGTEFWAEIGVGQDGILGTQDDNDVEFTEDQYRKNQIFTGLEDTLNTIAFGLPTGRGKQSASTSGTKWNDTNGNGMLDSGESTLADVIIYVDLNNDDDFSIGEPAAITDRNGEYAIRHVPTGTYAVREIVEPGWVQTYPESGEHLITFSGAGEVRGADFGNKRGSGDNSGIDFGDAPAAFPTTLEDNGARHGILPGFGIGMLVDGELDGQPNLLALGDDINDLADEDGVNFVTDVLPGAETRVNVTISNGEHSAGVLQAWIDFDSDGAWTTPGEQIFVDQAVVEGVNSLRFDVPAWATLGESFARFRYGYDRGISFDGASVAGEVEDHFVEIVRGGPVANDDAFSLRRNSEDVFLDVLKNDQFRPGTDPQIVEVTTPSSGGSVAITGDGLGLIYSTPFDFDGIDSFGYTIEDVNGLSDSANVVIDIQPDLATIRLGIADINDGTPITQVAVGEQFLLQAFVQDQRDPGSGVFAAYTDVEYPVAAANAQGQILYGSDYPNGQSGDVSVPGLMDEVGAFDGIDRLGPDEALLFSVPMRAATEGTFEFVPHPADVLPQHNVLLFDSSDPVPTQQIEYRGIEVVITDVVSNIKTNPDNPSDVNHDNAVSPIDALFVINELNDDSIPSARPFYRDDLFLDVNNDGVLSPIDVLLIINELNQASTTTGASAIAAAVQASDNNRQTKSETAGISSMPIAETGTVRVQLLQESESLFDTIEDVDPIQNASNEELDSVLALISDDVLKSSRV
ncbi:MAG: GEVED domain-containing protein [Pirellulaceae bacterium]|nr:GEVED domain-containing protein [Pirellulaceae bacterium]